MGCEVLVRGAVWGVCDLGFRSESGISGVEVLSLGHAVGLGLGLEGFGCRVSAGLARVLQTLLVAGGVCGPRARHGGACACGAWFAACGSRVLPEP